MKNANFSSACGIACLNLFLASSGWSQSTVVQIAPEMRPDNLSHSTFLPESMTHSRRAWETILEQIHPEIDGTTQRMDQLIAQLRRAGLPVILDVSAQDDSLSHDELVTLELPGEPLITRLNQAFSQHNAVLAIQEDRLQVVSLDVANDPEYFTSDFYDVTALVTDMDSLMETIYQNVAPDGWSETNGDATLTPITINSRKILSLAAPYQTHIQVRNLLAKLYRLSGGTAYTLRDTLPTSSLARGSKIIELPSKFEIDSHSPSQGRGLAGRRRGRGVGIGGFGGGGGVF